MAVKGVKEVTVAVNTTGGVGVSAGNADSVALYGQLLDIFLDFGAAPATTDVVITDKTRGDTILTTTNTGTDARIAPRQKLVDNANVAITNSHDRFPLNGPLNIAVAQCDDLTPALTAYIRYIKD
jgi:hypothetical protein